MKVAYTLEQCWHRVPGGSATAAVQLADALARRDDIELVGVAGRHRRPPEPSVRPNITMTWLPVARPVLYETWNRFGWPLVESVTADIDICHSTVAIPAATRAPSVVTVHDIAFVHHPERFTRRGVRVMNAGLQRCRRADIICVPSGHTATDLAEIGFDEDRIRVVPWGVDTIVAPTSGIDTVRRHRDLPSEFILFVGTLEPRKNLSRLASAVANLDTPLPLVIAGAPGWGTAATVPAGLDARFLGFVPADELRALYGAATVFAYPSLEEGFGLPILEAMVQSTPVVTSRGTATEATAAGAAELVDPTDIDSIGAGLERALANADDLIERGRQRVEHASWDIAADKTVAAYRDARG